MTELCSCIKIRNYSKAQNKKIKVTILRTFTFQVFGLALLALVGWCYWFFAISICLIYFHLKITSLLPSLWPVSWHGEAAQTLALYLVCSSLLLVGSLVLGFPIILLLDSSSC